MSRHAKALVAEKFGPLLVVGFLVAGIPGLGIRALLLLALPAFAQLPLHPSMQLLLILVAHITLSHLLPCFLLVGAIGNQAVDAMAGKPMRIMRCLKSAVACLPAMTLSALGIGAVIALSLPLLLIPAFALAPLMAMAPAACAIRQQDLSSAFAESAMLADRNRWTIIMAVACWFAAQGSISQASGLLTAAALATGVVTPSLVLVLALALLLITLEAIIGACIAIALYAQAREAFDERSMLDRIADA